MNQPELSTRILLAQIESNKDDYVTIPGAKKKVKVAPGEMECITLSPEQFANAEELSFALEV
jgi:hypothetical protein